MTEVEANLGVIGDGPLRDKLEELTLSLQLGQNIQILGKIPGDISPYDHAADVFAFCSIARSEAVGIVQNRSHGSGPAGSKHTA